MDKERTRPSWAAMLDAATYNAYIATTSTSPSSSEDEDDEVTSTPFTISKEYMPPLVPPTEVVSINALCDPLSSHA
jgi:hypothetical protein